MRLVDYKTAKKLKELGYNGEYSYYVDDDFGYVDRHCPNLYDFMIKAPYLENVVSWLRATYDIDVWIEPKMITGGMGYFPNVYYNGANYSSIPHKKYNDALDYAVKMALSMVNKAIDDKKMG